MGMPDHGPISADAFLAWMNTQDDRFELVDGLVHRMMAGAKQEHNVVTSNIVVALAPQAKRGGCRTTSSDTAVRTGPSGVRYPDVVVDCGPRNPSAIEATKPTLVLEVSSPGTSAIDATDKLDEYRDHSDIRLIVFVDPGLVSVKLYRRGPNGEWTVEKYDGLEQVVPLAEIGAALALGDIYDTLEPKHRTHLQLVESPAIAELS